MAENDDAVHFDEAASIDGCSDVCPPGASDSQDTACKEAEDVEEYFCGICNWHPKWLQVFRSAYFFTFMLCLNCFVEGAIVSGFTSVVLSSIERRYQFSSVAAGTVAASFDMAVLVSVVFISYFGGRSHKPRWLGISLLVQGLGAFIFALPQFIFGPYDIGQRGSLQHEACLDSDDFSPDCRSDSGGALAFFIIGEMLIGIGAAPLFTIGTSYLDDIVSPKKVPIHLGLFYAMTVVGPSLGYGLGGAFLSIYVDPGTDTNLEQTDPGWVGAWWIGFLLCSALSFLIAIPFLMFPRLLPDSHLVRAERLQVMAKKYRSKYGEREETDFIAAVKSFPTHLKLVFSNLAWIFITLAVTTSIIVISGMVSFAPKYLESQFTITASRASLIAGAVAIPAGGTGVVVGGLILFFSKAKGRQVVLINWVVSLLTTIPILVFLVHCPTLELAGITVPYPDSSLNEDLNSTCTLPCNCSSTLFEPVCGADQFTYFSPCRAGCDKAFIDGDLSKPIFENCSCIASRFLQDDLNSTATFDSVLLNSTALDGRCASNDCGKLMAVFLVFIAVGLVLIFILEIPNIIITIRCIADEQRTFALGAQSFVFRLFGSIPGPIFFGLIFDSACIFWQFECDRRGNCWLYDNKHLSERALALALIGSFLNFVFSFLCWLVYPKQVSGGEGDGEERGDQKDILGEDESRENEKEFTEVETPQYIPTSHQLEYDSEVGVGSANVVHSDLHGLRARSVESPDHTASPRTVELVDVDWRELPN